MFCSKGSITPPFPTLNLLPPSSNSCPSRNLLPSSWTIPYTREGGRGKHTWSWKSTTTYDMNLLSSLLNPLPVLHNAVQERPWKITTWILSVASSYHIFLHDTNLVWMFLGPCNNTFLTAQGYSVELMYVWWNGKDVERRGHSLCYGIKPWHSPGGTEGNHKNPHSGTEIQIWDH